MKIHESKAHISLKGNCNIIYRVAKISYLEREDGYTKYVFTPNYSVISLLTSEYFQGIPGLNLDLKRKEYIRENMTPVFISERVPQKNRANLYELLHDVDMEIMEPIEYLLRTKLQYFGDNLFLLPYKEKETFFLNKENEKKSNNALIKDLLNMIGAGDDVVLGEVPINDGNRKSIHDLLMFIYSRSIEVNKQKQKEGITKAREEGTYKGRKRKPVDYIKFLETLGQIQRKQISPKQAASNLGISIDKFYREKKRLMM